MWSAWWSIPVSILCALVVIWLILAATIWLTRPDEITVRDTVKLLPDLARLLKGLAADPSVPRLVRLELVAVLAFMVSPIDLIPDVIPVIGMLDDVILVGLVLRSVTRVAGPAAVARHWPGTPASPKVCTPTVRWAKRCSPSWPRSPNSNATP